ncbi:flagellar protein FlgN [Neobacillus pocheonensis]|uniref:flagellar protein FlgN n=1 Tax=Neobacillus pocheonensis TaxID=363869 RepID=UPI003D287840
MKPSEPLKTILQEMITVYEKLLDVGEEKQQAIIKGDPEQLLSIFPRESVLIKEISLLEGKRQAETLVFQSVSLSQMIENTSSANDKEELLFYQNELKGKLKELESQHQLNQRLIETSLQYIHNMLSLFTQKQDQSMTYSAKPYAKESIHSRSFFEAKV